MRPRAENPPSPGHTVRRRVLATLGVGGFVFFLLKGLVWLGVGAAAVFVAW